MVIKVTAKLDTEPLRRRLKQLEKAAARRTLQRSLSKAKRVMKTEARRQVQRRLNVSVRGFNRATKTTTALRQRRALAAEVRIQGLPVPAIEFRGTRQTKRGVSVQIKPGGARTIWKNSFIATMDSGHRGVFQRHPQKIKPRTKPKYHALSIREMMGPHVIRALDRPRTRRLVTAKGKRAFLDEFDRQVKLSLSESGR